MPDRHGVGNGGTRLGAVACPNPVLSFRFPPRKHQEFQHVLNESDRYKVLRTLEQNPEVSQRQLAEELGFSLGKLNYCLKALTEKGWVKVENFRNSRNKSAYLYKLTPSGITEKAQVTRRFLQRKIEEHEQLRQEIEQLQQEVK